jgi:hypothetical protein
MMEAVAVAAPVALNLVVMMMMMMTAVMAVAVVGRQGKLHRGHAAYSAHAIWRRAPAAILLAQLTVAINLCKTGAVRQGGFNGKPRRGLHAHMVTCSCTASTTTMHEPFWCRWWR